MIDENQRAQKLRTKLIYGGGSVRAASAKWGDKGSVFHKFGDTKMQRRAFLAEGGKSRLEKMQTDCLVVRDVVHTCVMHALHVIHATYW